MSGAAWTSVVETGPYLVRAVRLMSEQERADAVEVIARDPECGTVLEGAGGVRKVRFAIGNRGKSAGVRIVYYFHSDGVPVFLLAVFRKGRAGEPDEGRAQRARQAGEGHCGRVQEAGCSMSKQAFDAIKAGLEDALAHAKGKKTLGEAHRVRVRPVNVANVRRKLGVSQPEFAHLFCVSVGTLRNWEQGRRVPDGPARVLLNVIDREPEAVRRALG